jgi:hypothetical protein
MALAVISFSLLLACLVGGPIGSQPLTPEQKVKQKYQALWKIRPREMDESDLYGDIEVKGKLIELEELRAAFDLQKNQNQTLLAENEQLQAQIRALVADRTQLEANMVSLYKTAIAEVDRKDRALSALRGQLLHQTKSSSI